MDATDTMEGEAMAAILTAPQWIDVACFRALRSQPPPGGHVVTANTACPLLAAVQPGDARLGLTIGRADVGTPEN